MAFSLLAMRNAGSPGRRGSDFDGDGVAGDAADGVDDLLDGEAGAVAEVVDEPLLGGAGCFEGFQGEQVGVGEVAYVDVVANAGAVVGGVVVAEDLDGLRGGRGLRRG